MARGLQRQPERRDASRQSYCARQCVGARQLDIDHFSFQADIGHQGCERAVDSRHAGPRSRHPTAGRIQTQCDGRVRAAHQVAGR